VCRPIHPSSRSYCLDPFKSDEEFRLREQQGLSPLATSEYSSSGEEEEGSDGPPPLRGGSLRPPSPRAAEAAEEQALGAGTGASTARRSTEGAARVAEAPARATASGEPSRKRKRDFSTLR
jgi:hypothetical protein